MIAKIISGNLVKTNEIDFMFDAVRNANNLMKKDTAHLDKLLFKSIFLNFYKTSIHIT